MKPSQRQMSVTRPANVDPYADRNITDHVYFGAVAELQWANAAADEVFGDDDTYQPAEFQVNLTY